METEAEGETARHESVWRMIIECGAIIFVYAILHKLVFRYTYLPESSYEQGFLLPQAFLRPKLLITVILPMVVLFVRFRHLRWTSFEHGRYLRWFVFVVTLASAWTFASYEYNLYLDQSHALDRLLLLVFAGLVLWHPVFVAPYVLLGTVLVHQFHLGIAGFNWLDKRILFDVLILFMAVLYLSLLKKQRLAIYFGLVVCLLSANYFVPGLAKLRTVWVFEDDLANLALACHANGWLRGVGESDFVAAVQKLGWLNRPLVVGTLVIELLSLIIFVRRRFVTTMLLMAVALHVGIYISSGICFWKWALLNVLAIVFLARAPQSFVAPLFTRAFFVTSMAVIALSPLYARPTWLVWFDTPLDEFYEFEAVGQSGQVYHVPRTFMAPYDLVFAQNRFWYLTEEPLLVGTFGATSDIELDRALRKSTAEGVADLSKTQGKSRFNTQARDQLDRFLRIYFSTLNEGRSKDWLLSPLQPPFHIQSSPRDISYAGQEPVTEIRVWFYRRFYDGTKLVTLEERLEHSVPIPMTRAEAVGQG